MLDRQRIASRLEHWRQIAISACEQSGRVSLPRIEPPNTLAGAVETGTDDLRLLLDPRADRNVGEALAERPHIMTDIALLIGPEGGLTNAERSLAQNAGFFPVRLGPRVLRTETAPLVALSVIQYLKGDLA